MSSLCSNYHHILFTSSSSVSYTPFHFSYSGPMYLPKLDYFYCSTELTNSTEQSPSWEAYSHSASQEIHHHLWNQRHYGGVAYSQMDSDRDV